MVCGPLVRLAEVSMAKSSHHRDMRWHRLTREWLAAMRPTRCALCHRPLDPDAPARTPLATEVDLITAEAVGGDPWDQRNWQPAHKSCNASKGAGREARPPLVTSREW